MKTDDIKVRVGNEIIACSLDYNEINNKPSVIFLHGAGPSNKEQVKYLSELFVKNNQNVIRFDFSGQGESSGVLQEASLLKRQIEALAIIKYFNMNMENLTIVGTSMGGYIATSLAKLISIKNLILFCPAAYDIKAWDIQFNNGFTEILRRDISLLVSNIDDLLESFIGKSLLVLAEKDEIIQPIIVDMYQKVLTKKSNHFTYIIPESPHPIHRWVVDKDIVRTNILNEICSFMSFA